VTGSPGWLPASGSTVLGWIVGVKAVESLVLVGLGTTLLVARGADLVDLLVRAAVVMHLPVTSALFNRLLETALHVTVRREVALAVAAWGCAGVMGTEGVSLYLRRPWARWLSIGETCSFIPIELYQIVRAPHGGRAIVLVLNVAMVVWLWRRTEMFETPMRTVPDGEAPGRTTLLPPTA